MNFSNVAARQCHTFAAGRQPWSRLAAYAFSSVSTFALALSGPSYAQTQETSRIEEVVVTARKRAESLQDVPIAISAVTGESLQDNNIGNLETLAPSVPNFHFSEAVSGNDQVFMRGVGSGVNPGFENSVGQVIDGYFFGRSRYGRAAFLDLQQVEVLKGPQGALIGKNTSAGAINIRTAKPTEAFEGYITPTWEFEGNEGYGLEGAVSGALIESVRSRVAFRYDDHDGYMDNVFTGKDEVGSELRTIRVLTDIDLADNLTAGVLYQYGDQDRVGRNRELSKCGAANNQAAVFAPSGEDCRFNLTRSSANLRNGQLQDSISNTEFHLAGLTLTWDFDNAELTSLTGYSTYDAEDSWDGDNYFAEVVSLDATEEYEQWSQEIRIASVGDGGWDYIAGVFLQHIEQETHQQVHFNTQSGEPLAPGFPPGTRNIVTDQESDTAALFGQLTWRLAEDWDFTVGARYTHEEKEAESNQFATVLYTQTPTIVGGGPVSDVHAVQGGRSENDFSPNAVVQWRPNEDAMLYASVNRGFKGGGFDHYLAAPQSVASDRFEFEEEKVTAFEAGGKFTLFEGTAQLSVAAFRSEFDDLQVSTLVADQLETFEVGNAASAISQGLEADIRWRPLENLEVFTAVAYLDAYFDSYEDAPCYGGQPEGAGGCNGSVQDLSGKELQFSPEWTVTLNGEYTWHLTSGLDLSLFGQAHYMDSYALALDLDPGLFQKGYAKIDARLTLAEVSGRWQVSLVGRNLTDELTANFGNDAAAFLPGTLFRFAEPPRSVSLQAKIRF